MDNKNYLKGIRISNNKLKPLKGNTIKVSTEVSVSSIDKLTELGALVIRVSPKTSAEHVDAILESIK